ncbi:hypothetical protein Syun_003449 [Stephania yunnanensis]|uniref:EGF-like domain-containing protein n=1 Tax=Stephania yunnanensis TaxID=152371 RepID=A0AAP0PZV2_9MAGN
MLWPLLLIPVLFLEWSMAAPLLSQTKPGCPDRCGNISIPYPFGLGEDPSCFREETSTFQLYCNDSYNPPRLFNTGDASTPIINITLQGQATLLLWPATYCFYSNGTLTDDSFNVILKMREGYRFSYTRNKFTAIGCDTSAFMSDASGLNFQSGCYSFCKSISNVLNGSCSGIGCCQTAIPKDVRILNLTQDNRYSRNFSYTSNPCRYAFLVDNDWFTFYVSDLWNFSKRVEYKINNIVALPVAMDWAIRDLTCEEAKRNRSSYACMQHASCIDSSNGPGYLCRCDKGYEGNPYLDNGCQGV